MHATSKRHARVIHGRCGKFQHHRHHDRNRGCCALKSVITFYRHLAPQHTSHIGAASLEHDHDQHQQQEQHRAWMQAFQGHKLDRTFLFIIFIIRKSVSSHILIAYLLPTHTLPMPTYKPSSPSHSDFSMYVHTSGLCS